MDMEDARRGISITKWQALFNHEAAVWETDYASVKTARIDGTPSDDLPIKQRLAQYLSEIKSQEQQYVQRGADIAQRAAAQRGANWGLADAGAEYEAFLDDLGISPLEASASGEFRDEATSYDLVGPQDIDLLEVTDRSVIGVDIYPLTFRCRTCGHFQVVGETATDLTCPDCARRQAAGEAVRARPMVQESLVFVCPHCATIEEVTPQRTTVRNVQQGVFPCPTQCGGHLHFFRYGRLSAAQWKCTRCNYRESPVRRNCGCSIYGTDPADGPSIWPMRLNPTSASNTYALQKTFVEVGRQDISLPVLRAKRQQDQVGGKRSWQLEELLQGMDGFTRGLFRQTYDLADAFLVHDIESSTVVYGYTTRVMPANKDIRDSERLRKAFPTRSTRYRAYLIRSTGRGMVLVFDKAKIATSVQRGLPVTQQRTYDDLVEGEVEALNQGVFQDNLDNPARFPVMSAMHAIEHALFKAATEEAGLEVFGSKLLLRDGAMILFERDDIGDGGVVQLVTGKQFLRLANSIYTELATCGQDCDNGCLSCTFINDFNCAPFLETECMRWYPANSFLDRRLAKTIFGSLDTGE